MLYDKNLVLQHLKQLRKKKKYTQNYVSNFLGISRGKYAKLENGFNSLDLENIVKLAKLYNTTVEELLCLSNNKDNKNLININELDTVLKTGVTYNGKTLTSTDIIALKAFLQGLTSSK